MTLHLIKLCVGVDNIAEVAEWQTRQLARLKRRRKPPQVTHVTRMRPRREEELLDGGSLYWVIKGQIAVRQRFLDLQEVIKNGAPHCALVLDPTLVPTERRFHRPFQGWRYFDPKDAPRDLTRARGAAMPEELQAELVDLGLL
ncbi:MAG: DUF1489 family protein [Alphaproteobacteria bacterium]